jgi:hypothetical protein
MEGRSITQKIALHFGSCFFFSLFTGVVTKVELTRSSYDQFSPLHLLRSFGSNQGGLITQRLMIESSCATAVDYL